MYSAATDIKLKGAEWPLSDFEDSGGVTSGSWHKLSPGATVRVEYFLTPKASGPYAPLAATVTYKAESDAKTQVRLYIAATMLRCKVPQIPSYYELLLLLQVAYGATPSLYILSPTQKLMRTALSVVTYTPLLGRSGIKKPIDAAHMHSSRALTMHSLVQGSYLSLGMVRTPEQWMWAGSTVGGAAALLGGYWAYTVATDANKRKKYRQALEEVTKMS